MEENKPSKIIELRELLKRLNITRQTCDLYRDKGMPYSKAPGRNGKLFFDYPAVVAWLASHGGNNNG